MQERVFTWVNSLYTSYSVEILYAVIILEISVKYEDSYRLM